MNLAGLVLIMLAAVVFIVGYKGTQAAVYHSLTGA